MERSRATAGAACKLQGLHLYLLYSTFRQVNPGASHVTLRLHLSLLSFLSGTYAPKNTEKAGSFHKRKKPQAPTPQAPIRNRPTRKVANARGLNRNTNLT